MQSSFALRHSIYSLDIDINTLDITSYLSAPNRINTCNPHIGKIYRIFVDLSDMSYLEKNTPMYNKATHNMTKILMAFDSKTGHVQKDKDGNSKIQEVVDWPISEGIHGGEEWTRFFEWANHLNDYDPKIKSDEFKHGNFPIRYQTIPFNEKACSFNVFSQSEQDFLCQYKELREFSEFFRPINLFDSIKNKTAQEDAQNLLKTFEIKFQYSKIIECKSAEELQKLIPYVKRLLQFFPDVKTKTEEASSHFGIFRKYYQHESEQYLTKIEETILVFNEKNDALNLKLKGFLKDTQKQVWQLIVKGDTRIGLTKLYELYKKIESKGAAENDQHYSVLKLKQLLEANRRFNLKKFFQFEEIDHHLLMVECKPSSIDFEIVKGTFQNVFSVLKSKSKIKIILVTQDNDLAKLFENVINTEELSVKYQKTEDQEFRWNDLTDESQKRILQKEVTFQGSKISLNKLIRNSSDKINLPDGESKINELLDTKTLLKLYKNETISIGGDKLSTSGYDGSYYIQRSLNYQTNIKREIFTSGKEITETFVISGDINRNDIQVPNGSKLFIVPNNNEASEKFKDLSQGHWLKYETGSNSFVWQQSKGSLSVLREFIDDKSYTKTYTEEAMIKMTNTSKIIIISDTAGMGKSTILTHLALQIKKDPSNSDLWLIRINLNDYTDKLKELKEKRGIKELDLKTREIKMHIIIKKELGVYLHSCVKSRFI